MEFPFGEQIVRERRPSVIDPYNPGTQVPGLWEGPLDTLAIEDAFIASSSSVAPVDATRRQVLTEKSLYCTDPNVDVRVGDRIRRSGALSAPVEPVTITWPDGSKVILSRAGDIVTASAFPGSFGSSMSLAPLPIDFAPAGNVVSYHANASSIGPGTWAVLIDEIAASSSLGIGLVPFGDGPFVGPVSFRWLADPAAAASGGEVFYVNARPAADTNPFTDWQPVVEIPLDMTEG